MNKISANNFDIKAGKIEFQYTQIISNEITTRNIFFELNNDIIPSNDAIAYVIATFSGTMFDEISIDLPLSKNAKLNIENFTKATITAPLQKDAVINKQHQNCSNTILNFSGGFDSLAALYLIPGNVNLVSVDFGGTFSRERNFFEKFCPYTLKTNFRQEQLDKNSWTFMGAGALLYAEYLKAEYNVFGTILEATKYHFLQSPTAASTNITPPFSFLGLKDIRYLNGLTEVGTTMVVSFYAPDLIESSLCSLSSPKTEKRYRKEVLLEIICRKYNRHINFQKTSAPEHKIKFGENLALDFLCFYVIKNAGLSVANKTISEIPTEISEIINSCKLSFYERLNCAFICGNTFPTDATRSYFMQRLLKCGVLPYDENDYHEYRIVTNFLNKYHHIY